MNIAPLHLVMPSEHLTALGEVTAYWGHCEQLLSAKLSILQRHPDVRPKQPREFSKRASMMKEAARICFPDHETLVAKITGVVDRACHLAAKRNDMIHGLWFNDWTPSVWLNTMWDGTGTQYRVEAAEIKNLSRKIGQLYADTAFMLGPTGEPLLTLPERLAWQDFQERFPPPTPTPRSRPHRLHTFRA
jgi:hypothetical protein